MPDDETPEEPQPTQAELNEAALEESRSALKSALLLVTTGRHLVSPEEMNGLEGHLEEAMASLRRVVL